MEAVTMETQLSYSAQSTLSVLAAIKCEKAKMCVHI